MGGSLLVRYQVSMKPKPPLPTTSSYGQRIVKLLSLAVQTVLPLNKHGDQSDDELATHSFSIEKHNRWKNRASSPTKRAQTSVSQQTQSTMPKRKGRDLRCAKEGQRGREMLKNKRGRHTNPRRSTATFSPSAGSCRRRICRFWVACTETAFLERLQRQKQKRWKSAWVMIRIGS